MKQSRCSGRRAHAYRAESRMPPARKQLFEQLANDFGKLDIVFANAGISGRTPTGTADESVFENIIHINLTGAFLNSELCRSSAE